MEAACQGPQSGWKAKAYPRDGEPWEGLKGGSVLDGLCPVAGAEDQGSAGGRLGPEEVTSACVPEREEAL